MGMSIDAHIRGLVYLKKCGVLPFSDTRTGIIVTDESLEVAINIMRKYQKIERILKDDTYYEEYGNNAERFIVSAICEVLEDGKID